MYVRWKRRARKRTLAGESTQLLTATLVESRRVDGKPRQHIVAYLGSIHDVQLKYPLPSERFWRAASNRLDALGLHDVERTVIEAALSEVVPRPQPEEVARVEKERDRFYEVLRGVAQSRRHSRGGVVAFDASHSEDVGRYD
jgi:hypothetical protein